MVQTQAVICISKEERSQVTFKETFEAGTNTTAYRMWCRTTRRLP